MAKDRIQKHRKIRIHQHQPVDPVHVPVSHHTCDRGLGSPTFLSFDPAVEFCSPTTCPMPTLFIHFFPNSFIFLTHRPSSSIHFNLTYHFVTSESLRMEQVSRLKGTVRPLFSSVLGPYQRMKLPLAGGKLPRLPVNRLQDSGHECPMLLTCAPIGSCPDINLSENADIARLVCT